jgi:Flp pilus assembly pilin Flp
MYFAGRKANHLAASILSFGKAQAREVSGGKMLHTFNRTLKRVWEEIEGQDLIEYALLIVLVSLLSVAAMRNLASGISNAYGKAATQLNTATGGGGGNNGGNNGNNGGNNGNNGGNNGNNGGNGGNGFFGFFGSV